jgi:hypothetical protein
MKIERIEYGGWPNNLLLANEHAELVITLDVGPRVISYKKPGGENVFKNYAEHIGTRGESEWLNRGGHRFWLAPENERTYALDNSPVKHEVLGEGSVRLVDESAARFGIRKELSISLAPDSSQVTLEHSAVNESGEPAQLATWALSVMIPGGLELIPLPPLGEHPRDLLPNRTIVAWPYTDLSDPRWRFGALLITLRQTGDGAPAKLGLAHREKWIGYLTRSDLFIKTFVHEEGAAYPDFGCNFETFTNSDMLEIESLGPLRTLAPGESVAHTERWHLLAGMPEPESLKERALVDWIEPLLKQIGI